MICLINSSVHFILSKVLNFYFHLSSSKLINLLGSRLILFYFPVLKLKFALNNIVYVFYELNKNIVIFFFACMLYETKNINISHFNVEFFVYTLVLTNYCSGGRKIKVSIGCVTENWGYFEFGAIYIEQSQRPKVFSVFL